MAVSPTRRLFTVDEYHRMGKAGILTEDDRVELIDGEIVEMTAIGSPHGGCVNRLNRLLVLGLEGRAIVGIQNPVILHDLLEPQPDVSVMRPRDDDYSASHPGPNDLLLLIEVADTTVRFDREIKRPRYAAAGVRESWIVNLEEDRIEVYRDPTDDGYQETSILRRGDGVSASAFPDLVLDVDEILGPRAAERD